MTAAGRDAFKGFLSAMGGITEDDWLLCARVLMTERYAQGCDIQRIGTVCDRVRFLVSGLARSYLLDEKGRDFTWFLHFNEVDANMKNRFVIDYASYTQGEPSRLCIEALTDVELVSIRKADVEQLFATSPTWANVGRLMSDLAYYHTHHRALSLLTLPAKARYQQLLDESPALLRVAPQHYIASYLGITPQSLSRLRRDLANQLGALPNGNDEQGASR